MAGGVFFSFVDTHFDTSVYMKSEQKEIIEEKCNARKTFTIKIFERKSLTKPMERITIKNSDMVIETT